MLECPECGGKINIDQDPLMNEIIECEECGSQLVVKEVNPSIVLEGLEGVEEDWGE
jgi:alpha-aminoadipate carrier protein LysW